MSMVDTIRAALGTLYTGKCDVIEHRPVKDGHITRSEEITVLTDQPCRLSFDSIPAADNADGGGAALTQVTKLFLPPGVSIRPGSKITVTQNGQTTAYSQSGQPAVYESHIEITLQLFKRWA
ncbi:MAG: hypothetical protein E7572_12500 [Ruminococcaceae bacterium]|jgi:hypothetical protein|nr:hypothetical protein [Oscillospiraceae bacterium]